MMTSHGLYLVPGTYHTRSALPTRNDAQDWPSDFGPLVDSTHLKIHAPHMYDTILVVLLVYNGGSAGHDGVSIGTMARRISQWKVYIVFVIGGVFAD